MIPNDTEPPDGAMIIRCIAVFVGVYQATTVSIISLVFMGVFVGVSFLNVTRKYTFPLILSYS